MDTNERNNGNTENIQDSQNESGNELDFQNQKGKPQKISIFVRFSKLFNVATVIATLALLVSFTTTLISFLQAKEQNIHNQKNELRLLLQRTMALPKENAEIMIKYSDNPEALASISSYLNQENVLLFNQIDNLLNIIPQERLYAIEYYSASMCLMNSGNFYEAKRYIEKALEMKITDFNIELGLLRQHANVLFQIGEYDNGRKAYEKVLHIFDKYSHYNVFLKSNTHIQTELSWAYSEANSSNFDKVHIHIENAKKHLSELPETQARKNYENQIHSVEMNMGSIIRH